MGAPVQGLQRPAQGFDLLLRSCLVCFCLFQLSQDMLHILKHAFENLSNTVHLKNCLR
jgi:hypothetical protein